MTRIGSIFDELRAAGRTTLIPFVTGGYPSLEDTARAIPALEAAGARIVEIGIPFSDPIADGPLIASSMHEALTAGVTPAAVLDMVRRIRPGTGLALVAMVSVSIVERMGPARFAAEVAGAGMQGLIVPDLDLDSPTATTLHEAVEAHDLGLTHMVSPTTPSRRLGSVLSGCRGFAYLLARAGLTGERAGPPDVAARVREIRERSDVPVAVGFGISTAEQVGVVTRVADAAIVGSAFVRSMGDAADPAAAAAELAGTLIDGLTHRDRPAPASA